MCCPSSGLPSKNEAWAYTYFTYWVLAPKLVPIPGGVHYIVSNFYTLFCITIVVPISLLSFLLTYYTVTVCPRRLDPFI